MKKFTFIFAIMFLSALAFGAADGPTFVKDLLATSSIKVGGTGFANSKAALEINSTTKGFLPPRLTTTQKNAISSPPTSLLVFDSTLTKFQFYDGASWLDIGSGTITALTGDVVASGTGSVPATIQSGVVSNSKLATMGAHTFKGNNAGSTGAPLDLTATQLTAELNSFTSSLAGLVPASGGGTTNFLRADGTFAAPTGGSFSLPIPNNNLLTWRNAGNTADLGVVNLDGSNVAHFGPNVPSANQIDIDASGSGAVIISSHSNGHIELDTDSFQIYGNALDVVPVQFADNASGKYIALQAPTPVANNATLILPNGVGTAGQVLSTDGGTPANLSWITTSSSGANSTLSNLGTTTINANLLFNTSSGGQTTWSVKPTTNVSNTTGDALIVSSGLGTRNSGDLTLQTANQSISLVGNPSGNILVKSGDSNHGPTGTATFQSGDFASSNTNTSTGVVTIRSGNENDASFPSGDLIIATGTNAQAGGTGNISITPGAITGGTRGKLKLADGSEGTSGYVWTSTDAFGNGHWAAASGGGITELTGDVTAGPGSGSQAAVVAKIQGTAVAASMSPANADVLTWNATSNHWVNVPIAASGGFNLATATAGGNQVCNGPTNISFSGYTISDPHGYVSGSTFVAQKTGAHLVTMQQYCTGGSTSSRFYIVINGSAYNDYGMNGTNNPTYISVPINLTAADVVSFQCLCQSGSGSSVIGFIAPP